MTTIITRLYAVEKQAQAAVKALKDDFGDDQITLHAKEGGNALVTVRADWGKALAAIRHLDAHQPIESHEYTHTVSDPAPFSALLGLPQLFDHKPRVTLSQDATPLSSSVKFPVLSNLKSKTGLLDNAAPLSSGIGLATISRAKPFSGLLPSKSGLCLIR